MQSAFVSWKTSLFGVAAGALTLMVNGLDWKHALLAAALAGFGLSAKDRNVTNSVTATDSHHHVEP